MEGAPRVAFLWRRGWEFERAAPAKPGQKVSAGHFFSPWENPLHSSASRQECGWNATLRKSSESPIKVTKYLFRTDYPNQYNPNQFFRVEGGSGFIVFFDKFDKTHFRNGVIKRPESKPRGPRKKKQNII